jgi:transposase
MVMEGATQQVMGMPLRRARSLAKIYFGNAITDVAREVGATYDALLGALRRQIATEVSWAEVVQLEALGIDEIALKIGHRDFVVLLTARQADGQVRLLGVLPDRRLETVAGFLRAIPGRLQAMMREDCTDMYEGFTSAVKQAMPRARVVVDRFHVAKTPREDADK